MAKKPPTSRTDNPTRDEAMKIARGTQRPGQTKEQTKLIAQGIQKGIEQYKKQMSGKARELDKPRIPRVSRPCEPAEYPRRGEAVNMPWHGMRRRRQRGMRNLPATQPIEVSLQPNRGQGPPGQPQ